MRRFILFLIIGFLISSSAFASAQWVSQTSPVTYQLKDVHAINETTAVAVGALGTIIRTTDRGLSWEVEEPEDANKDFVAVHFPTALYGYTAGTLVADTLVFKSTDGGDSWSQSSLTAHQPINDIHFVSTTDGYFCNQKSGGISEGCYKSIDGGANWNPSGAGLTDAIYYSIDFIDPNIGWICGQGGRIFKTSNGGSNWSPQASGTAVDLKDIFFQDPNNGWAVGSNVTLRTTDGGSNWTPQTHLIDLLPPTLNAVCFVDENNGWAVGGYGAVGVIMTTTDGGDTWSYDKDTSNLPLYGVDFSDEYNGWAVGGNSSKIFKYVRNPDVTLATQEGTSPPLSKAPQGRTCNVIITGNYFQTGCTASFSGTGITVNSTILNSETQVTANITVAKDATLGYRDVTATNIDTGSGTLIDGLEITPNPIITSVTPPFMTQGDTGILTFSGANYQSGITPSDVVFSSTGISVNSITVNGANNITAEVIIAGTAQTGLSDLTITNPDFGITTEADIFSVNPSGVIGPTVTSVSPEFGEQGQTLEITITGANFHNGASPPAVYIGNGGITVVGPVTWIDANTIKADITIAADAATTWRTVTVINSDDFGVGSKSQAFRVTVPGVVNPTVTSVIPDNGYIGAGEINCSINGSGFKDDGAEVVFNTSDIIVISASVRNSTGISAKIIIPSIVSPGQYDVIVTNDDGGSGIGTGIFEVRAQSPKTRVLEGRGYGFPNPWNGQTDLKLQWNQTKNDTVILRAYSINGYRLFQSDPFDAKAGYNNFTIDRNDFPIQELLSNQIMLIVVCGKNDVLAKIKVAIENQN